MTMAEKLLNIENLVVHYETEDGVVEAVNNISFGIEAGETLGLVGETGAGKTTIALSIMGLLPKPPAHIVQGSIMFDGKDLTTGDKRVMRQIRGGQISMIFQDPMTALNPVIPVGEQIAEVVRLHEKISKKEALERAKQMLAVVGIPAERCNEYPHQFSGGMKQRVVIAIALACNPKLLIADEPTTALDVTIQAQVLELMKDLKKKYNTSLLMITHDFGVVADICEKCAVIYAGEIVEYGSVEDIFDHAMHPYTIALFEALPSLDKDVERLKAIDGMMLDPTQLPSYCSFYDRCRMRTAECMGTDPMLVEVTPGHYVKCARCRNCNQADGISGPGINEENNGKEREA